MRTTKAICLALLTLVLAAAVVGTGGCTPVIGWFANAFAPPQKVKALYKPPPGKTVLVFVDDMLSPVSYERVKAELTGRLNRQLAEHGIAGKTIGYDELLVLISATPNFNELAISEVGRKLGADVVLYVQITGFSLKDEEGMPLWRGRLATAVRFVGVEAGRLWPEDRQGGYPVEPVEIPPSSHPSPTYGEALSKMLAEKMADSIAKLFYDHEISAQEAARRQQKS